MQGITFTIQNPDSKPKTNAPVIYYDNQKASHLNLLLTQDLGITQLSKGDTITILFPASLLQTISKDNVLSKGWDVKIEMPAPGNQNRYSITLSPTGTVDFGNSELAINLQMLQGKSQTNGEITVSVSIGESTVPMVNHSVKLFVLAYPNQANELDGNILSPSISFNDKQSSIEDYGHLFISNQNVQPPIANQVKVNLKFSESKLVEKWDTNKKPYFNISFSYGNSSNDLTDQIKAGYDGYNKLTSAYSIVASVGEKNLWQVSQATDTTTWQFVPTDSNHHLFTAENDNLDIVLDHLISRLPEGDATIYIHWGYIPGYNDGWMALDIPKKKAPPEVISFTCADGNKSANIKYGEGVLLNFEVFGAAYVELRCHEDSSLKQRLEVYQDQDPALFYHRNSVNVGIPVNPKNQFYLKAVDKEGKQLGEEVGPIEIIIDDYPSPEFDAPIKILNAIVPFSDEDKGTFYMSPFENHLDIEIDLAHNTTKVLEYISISGPAGTIREKIDPQATKAIIPFTKEKTCTIALHGKNGVITTKIITLNRLFNKQLKMQYSHPCFTKKLFKLKNNATVELIWTAEVQFEISSNKQGVLSIIPGTAEKNLHFLNTLVDIPFKPIPSISFSWDIESRYGTITLTFDNGKHIVLSARRLPPPDSGVAYTHSTVIVRTGELHYDPSKRNSFTSSEGLNSLGITIENDDIIQKPGGSLKAELVFAPPIQTQQLFFESSGTTFSESKNNLTRN